MLLLPNPKLGVDFDPPPKVLFPKVKDGFAYEVLVVFDCAENLFLLIGLIAWKLPEFCFDWKPNDGLFCCCAKLLAGGLLTAKGFELLLLGVLLLDC